MNETTELQDDLVKAVSRSFFLSLKILPKRVRPSVSLGYILCRAADCIADTGTFPLADRLRLLGEFKRIFTAFPLPLNDLTAYIDELSHANMLDKTKEGQLLAQLGTCGNLFRKLSRTDQTLVQDVVAAVIEGMEIDLGTFGEPDGSIKALKSEHDLERYIHWIGGEPGRFWTKITLAHYPLLAAREREAWLAQGILFGTGVQLVNILRDLPQDLKLGRCYIPSDLLQEYGLTPADILNKEKYEVFLTIYNKLIDKALYRLENGLTYLRQIPWHSVRLRAAVWWPLILGVQTLEKLRKTPSFASEKPVKISRAEVYKTLAYSLVCLTSNRMLREDFERKADRI